MTLKRKTPLRRKKPMKRKAPKIRKSGNMEICIPRKSRKPIKKAKASTKNAQVRQRRRLALRSGGRCEMEIRFTDVRGCGIIPHEGEAFDVPRSRKPVLVQTDHALPGRSIWQRCTAQARDAAHIYSRPKCGRARDLEDVVLHACRACHDTYDGRRRDSVVRAPLELAQRAWDTVLDLSRLGSGKTEEERLKKRLEIHIGYCGPRPEKGMEPY